MTTKSNYQTFKIIKPSEVETHSGDDPAQLLGHDGIFIANYNPDRWVFLTVQELDALHDPNYQFQWDMTSAMVAYAQSRADPRLRASPAKLIPVLYIDSYQAIDDIREQLPELREELNVWARNREEREAAQKQKAKDRNAARKAKKPKTGRPLKIPFSHGLDLALLTAEFGNRNDPSNDRQPDRDS